jgi:hypothetical protein
LNKTKGGMPWAKRSNFACPPRNGDTKVGPFAKGYPIGHVRSFPLQSNFEMLKHGNAEN